MTVHMVRLYLDPPRGNAEQAVDNWVQNHPEWADDPVAHSLTEISPPDSDTTYVVGNYRFEQDDTATALLDAIETRLSNLQGGLWYRIGYHVCDHDEDGRDGCEWDPTHTREGGTVPEDIPTFGGD